MDQNEDWIGRAVMRFSQEWRQTDGKGYGDLPGGSWPWLRLQEIIQEEFRGYQLPSTPEDDAARDIVSLALSAALVCLGQEGRWDSFKAQERAEKLDAVQRWVLRRIEDWEIEGVRVDATDAVLRATYAVRDCLKGQGMIDMFEYVAMPLHESDQTPEWQAARQAQIDQENRLDRAIFGGIAPVLHRLALAWTREKRGRKYVPQPPLGALKSTR